MNKKKFKVPWIATFGAGYEEAKYKCKSLNQALSLCETWRGEQVDPVLMVVPRRAPNIKDLLFKRKSLALGSTSDDVMVPCSHYKKCRGRGRICQCCSLVSGSRYIKSNGTTVKTMGGNCKSFNVVYCAQCKLCDKYNTYVGKTVTPLHERMNKHRTSFTSIVKILQTNKTSTTTNLNNLNLDDTQIMGAHLFLEHNIFDKNYFDSSYTLSILSHCNPLNIRRTEQHFIDKLKTLNPFGLNQCNSVGD